MTSIIVTSLLKTGPCLSSVLVEEMLKTPGVNRDTARIQLQITIIQLHVLFSSKIPVQAFLSSGTLI